MSFEKKSKLRSISCDDFTSHEMEPKVRCFDHLSKGVVKNEAHLKKLLIKMDELSLKNGLSYQLIPAGEEFFYSPPKNIKNMGFGLKTVVIIKIYPFNYSKLHLSMSLISFFEDFIFFILIG
jgi:hypothetical protein